MTEIMTETDTAPWWTAIALLGAWLLWLVSFPDLAAERVSVIAVIGTLSIFLSIPLLWYDAREAIRAGDLEASRPIFVVVAVYLLYALSLPVYVGFRVHKARQTQTTDVQAAE